MKRSDEIYQASIDVGHADTIKGTMYAEAFRLGAEWADANSSTGDLYLLDKINTLEAALQQVKDNNRDALLKADFIINELEAELQEAKAKIFDLEAELNAVENGL